MPRFRDIPMRDLRGVASFVAAQADVGPNGQVDRSWPLVRGCSKSGARRATALQAEAMDRLQGC
jgi:hypothetical protein